MRKLLPNIVYNLVTLVGAGIASLSAGLIFFLMILDFLSRVENPYLGDKIDYEWFREKRYGKYRIYFIIYEEMNAVFMVATSDKNDQQKVINTIKFLFDLFKDEITKLISEDKLPT